MSLFRTFQSASLALVGVVSLSACRGYLRAGGGSPGGVATAGGAAPVLMRVYDSKAQTFVPFAQFVEAASKADIVFFGEQHDDPATHAVEVATFAALGERRERIVLSMEMFETDVQPQLNLYLAGTISEAAFLTDGRPWPKYSTDYRPLVELARIRSWPVVAANVPRRLASIVSKSGLRALDSVSTADRALVARENVCPKDAYYKNFVAEMGGMSGHGGSTGTMSASDSAAARTVVDRFYESQCVKDETMGSSIAAAYSTAGAGAFVFQVDGAFHSNFGLGTAARVRRRLPSAKTLVITAVPVTNPATAAAAEYADRADYVILTRAPNK
jgi:uncharacterized iron-regulated protein